MMINSPPPPPNSRALLPTFRMNWPDGISFCPDGVSFWPEYHPQPLFFTLPSHSPSPTPKQTFSWPELESGQTELPPGQPGPIWAIRSKSGQNFSRSGQTKFIQIET